LFFDGADGDAEAVGDFAVGKEFDFAKEENGAAAGGNCAMAVSRRVSSWRAMTCCSTLGEAEAALSRSGAPWWMGEMLRRLRRLIARRRAVR